MAERVESKRRQCDESQGNGLALSGGAMARLRESGRRTAMASHFGTRQRLIRAECGRAMATLARHLNAMAVRRADWSGNAVVKLGYAPKRNGKAYRVPAFAMLRKAAPCGAEQWRGQANQWESTSSAAMVELGPVQQGSV